MPGARDQGRRGDRGGGEPDPAGRVLPPHGRGNIDLKGLTDEFYGDVCSGHLRPVLDTLEYMANETDVWLEVTTPLISGLNDSDRELGRMSEWFAGHLGPDVPWHFTAFYPNFRLTDRPPAPPETLRRARTVAKANGLRHVYVGNVHDPERDSTYCRGCGELLIGRDWCELTRWHLTADGRARIAGCVTRVVRAAAGRVGRAACPAPPADGFRAGRREGGL